MCTTAMTDEDRVCGCGKGYVSAHDGKCGHCRTKREKAALEAFWRAQDKLEKVQEELRQRILK